MKGTIVFDVETHSADLLYEKPPHEFVRLSGYKFVGDEQVTITENLEELRDAIRSARWIIGHNIHAFDLKAVFGADSNEPLQMAEAGRVYDTYVHAPLVFPAPERFTNRHGKTVLANSPSTMRRWFSLDELAHQLGVPGKTDNIRELAEQYGNPELSKQDRINNGFGKIPVDSVEYRDYLAGDVEASERVAKALLEQGPLDRYAMREQHIAARAAVISSNGLRIDREAAQARSNQLRERRNEIVAQLEQDYGLPSEGKAPWATDEGKAAIFRALADHGITEHSRPDWPRTATGNLSLGGKALIDLTRGTGAEHLGEALAELKGQRALSDLALESAHTDGKVHPDINMLQRSGRWSTTKPGLTVWTGRGDGAVEKSYFLPDSDDDVLLEIDYSNADARGVAWLSGDTRYAERFEPGADGHMINAIAAWGEEEVNQDPSGYRERAKPLGHGWSYGGQPRTLSRVSGVPLEDAERFSRGMAAQFRRLVAWQESVRREARKGYVLNPWGRKMFVEKGREFTQAPALKGQSATREVVCDALLRMPHRVLRRVKLQIHDSLLFSVPKRNWEECRDYLVELMHVSMSAPPGGQAMEFPATANPAGENWMEASKE